MWDMLEIFWRSVVGKYKWEIDVCLFVVDVRIVIVEGWVEFIFVFILGVIIKSWIK